MHLRHALAVFLVCGSALTVSSTVLAVDNNMPPDMKAQMKADDERHAQWEAMISEQRKMDDRHLQDQRAMEDRHYKERKALLDKQRQERDSMFEKTYPMDDGRFPRMPRR